MDPSPEVRIGERLRFYRQAKGKTQALVAGLAGRARLSLDTAARRFRAPAGKSRCFWRPRSSAAGEAVGPGQPHR
jgi:hypothetical protein